MKALIKHLYCNGFVFLRQIKAIYLKDFIQILFSPMFLVILGACCLLWSSTYVRYFFLFAAQSVSMPLQQNQELASIHYTVFVPFISQINLLLVFIAPALTMRLLSEEKKLNTFDLLLSAPLNSTQIILGKFFSAYTAMILLISVSFLYIVLTSFFADFNWTIILIAYLGVILMSGAYTALGLFASSLTRSVVLSVILGVIMNVGIWFVSQSSDVMDDPVFKSVMDFFSVADHLINFAKGTIVISSAVFFIVIMVFFVFLARQMVEISRWK